MTISENASAWPDHKPTALLVLADGTVLEGFGLGAEGHAVGEVDELKHASALSTRCRSSALNCHCASPTMFSIVSRRE